ncbi:hypothetical protein [Micromonospora sp. NPDC049274]|uniref:hypothetical protein n=1 Tax=Micromonospora sp. NPDC049274 TaxID=3154829 RepID=UPI003418436C
MSDPTRSSHDAATTMPQPPDAEVSHPPIRVSHAAMIRKSTESIGRSRWIGDGSVMEEAVAEQRITAVARVDGAQAGAVPGKPIRGFSGKR